MLNNSKQFFVSRRLQIANGTLLRSANQVRVILALGQSGISNFALVLKKIKKKCPLSTISAFSNFALYVIKKEKMIVHVHVGHIAP